MKTQQQSTVRGWVTAKVFALLSIGSTNMRQDGDLWPIWASDIRLYGLSPIRTVHRCRSRKRATL